jgi:hypothetical protein
MQVPGEAHPFLGHRELRELATSGVDVPDDERQPGEPEHHQAHDQRGKGKVGDEIGAQAVQHGKDEHAEDGGREQRPRDPA